MGLPHRISPVLMMMEGDTPGRLFELSRQETLIGRNPQCQIVLNAREISRKHARITHEGGRYYIRDLGSRCGTQVNDETITSACLLEHESIVRVWTFAFRFQDPAMQADDRGDDHHHSTIIKKVRGVFEEEKGRLRSEDLRHKLDGLLEISKSIFRNLDLKEVLETTVHKLFEVFPETNRGFVLLKDKNSGELVPKAMRATSNDSGKLKISHTIVNMVMNNGEAILSKDASNDANINYAESIRQERLRTLMSVPLIDRGGKTIGLIQLDTSTEGREYNQDDLDVLIIVAGFVSVAVENASLHAEHIRKTTFEAEEDHARRVQRLFLPKARPQLYGYEFWDCYQPAVALSGDYFGYMTCGGGKQLAVMIGDVSGKGMPAALIMAKLSSEARLAVNTETEPGRVVDRLNAQILRDELDGMFVTFLLAWLDVDCHKVRFVRAGHHGPLVRRADGSVEIIGKQGGGPPLGLVGDCTYEASEVDLEPGDVLLLYTDGVSDAQDERKSFFGAKRVEALVRETAGGAGNIGRAIIQAVEQHSRNYRQTDDITIICLGRLRLPEVPIR